MFASIKTFGIVQSDDSGNSWESMVNVDLTVTSITTHSQNYELYVAGFSSDGYQEVYKVSYDGNSYDLIGTNKGLR